MNKKVNIGIVQFESISGDVKANVKKAIKLIEEAALKNADIVCLPELFATGYDLGTLKEKIVEMSIEHYDFIVNSIADCAKENEVYVLAPFGEIRNLPSIVYNSAILFDDEGKKVGSYAKTHLHESDKPYFGEGNNYPIFKTKYGNIGVLICFDLVFPETCRSLCLNGAEIVIAPSAWEIEYLRTWRAQLTHRALENILFTVGVNRVGREGGAHYFGQSMVCNPNGDVIAELPMDKELVEVVTINLADISKFRTQTSFLRDRKPQTYGNIVKVD